MATRKWYISIVPVGMPPGTSADIDFYYAIPDESETPPYDGWVTCDEGINPPPTTAPHEVD